MHVCARARACVVHGGRAGRAGDEQRASSNEAHDPLRLAVLHDEFWRRVEARHGHLALQHGKRLVRLLQRRGRLWPTKLFLDAAQSVRAHVVLRQELGRAQEATIQTVRLGHGDAVRRRTAS